MYNHIIAERSQQKSGGKVWWWLTGDTYPHRELLKCHGARFSSRRKAWYWIGDLLHAAIQALVNDYMDFESEILTSLEENVPC